MNFAKASAGSSKVDELCASKKLDLFTLIALLQISLSLPLPTPHYYRFIQEVWPFHKSRRKWLSATPRQSHSLHAYNTDINCNFAASRALSAA